MINLNPVLVDPFATSIRNEKPIEFQWIPSLYEQYKKSLGAQEVLQIMHEKMTESVNELPKIAKLTNWYYTDADPTQAAYFDFFIRHYWGFKKLIAAPATYSTFYDSGIKYDELIPGSITTPRRVNRQFNHNKLDKYAPVSEVLDGLDSKFGALWGDYNSILAKRWCLYNFYDAIGRAGNLAFSKDIIFKKEALYINNPLTYEKKNYRGIAFVYKNTLDKDPIGTYLVNDDLSIEYLTVSPFDLSGESSITIIMSDNNDEIKIGGSSISLASLARKMGLQHTYPFQVEQLGLIQPNLDNEYEPRLRIKIIRDGGKLFKQRLTEFKNKYKVHNPLDPPENGLVRNGRQENGNGGRRIHKLDEPAEVEPDEHVFLTGFFVHITNAHHHTYDQSSGYAGSLQTPLVKILFKWVMDLEYPIFNLTWLLGMVKEFTQTTRAVYINSNNDQDIILKVDRSDNALALQNLFEIESNLFDFPFGINIKITFFD